MPCSSSGHSFCNTFDHFFLKTFSLCILFTELIHIVFYYLRYFFGTPLEKNFTLPFQLLLFLNLSESPSVHWHPSLLNAWITDSQLPSSCTQVIHKVLSSKRCTFFLREKFWFLFLTSSYFMLKQVIHSCFVLFCFFFHLFNYFLQFSLLIPFFNTWTNISLYMTCSWTAFPKL